MGGRGEASKFVLGNALAYIAPSELMNLHPALLIQYQKID